MGGCSGRAAPEAALVAGWGGACVALTLWGVATAASLRWPATAIAAAGLVGLVAPRVRPDGAAWRGVLRMGVVALPLLAVMASARPSLPDTFLNLLPNAAYLYDHAGFPADDRSPSHSFLPGAPYNMQLAAFTAALFTPGFPPAAMIGINLILQLAFALFLARLIERGDDAAAILPTWGATALGLLLATLINPGFVPRYHLSAYSETSVTVALAFAAWFAARALDRCAAQRTASAELTLLALTLAALVNIKQDSIALVAGLLGSALVLALLQGREGRGRALAALLLAAAPALLLYAAWRWYVLSHFAAGELKPLPFAQWQFVNIPLILRSMLKEMLEKGYFFVAALCPLALASLLRFDLEVPQLRTWQLAAIAKARLGTERRLALVLPGDNGSVTAMLEGLIRFVPPAQPDLDLRSVTALAPETFDRLARDGYRLALISCTAAGSHDVPAGRAVLLEHGAGGWRAAAQEAYPVPRSRRWSHVLLDAPLCL